MQMKYKRAGMQGLNLMNWIEVDELSSASSTTSQVPTGSNSESLIQSLIDFLYLVQQLFTIH